MDDCDDNIFNNNPIYMKSLIGKKVEIETVENASHSGTVYVIDPIYKTVVLHTNRRSEEKYDTVFVFYHAIKNFKILSDEIEEGYLNKDIYVDKPQPANSKDRKTLLKTWLKNMYINVVESGDYLKIDDHLLIVPPYGPENCISNNTIILERIQEIISSMPSDFRLDL